MMTYLKKKQIILLFVLFLISIINAQAQKKTISGIVTDAELGLPLPAVTVLVKGTSKGTITNFDGEYTLNTSEVDKTLVFSYIGYKTQEVSITNKSTFNVKMIQDVSQLEEVVIIDYGYGKVKKSDMSGATVSVSAKELSVIPVSSAAEALSGRLAGVNVTSADGEPGSEVSIRIRGGTSLSQDNSPVFVVDGFIVESLDDIPVNDIESIDVLKDAAATAIYGARASNGVVVVTTKQPVEGKVSVSYNNFYRFSVLPGDRAYETLSPYEFVLANYEYNALIGEENVTSFEKFYGKYDDFDLYKDQKGTDWQDEMFGGSRLSQYHNLSIGGGSKMTKLNLSLSNNKDEGLLETSAYERTTLNLKITQKISKTLSFNAQARITNSVKDGAGTSSGQIKLRDAIQARPVNGIADELDLDLSSINLDDDYQQYLLRLVDPTRLVEQDWRKRTDYDYRLNASLTWAITKAIRARSSYSNTHGNTETLRYYGPLTGESRNNGGSMPLGLKQGAKDHGYRWINTLNYKKRWNDSKLDLLIGHEISSDGGQSDFLRSEGFRLSITPEELFANMQLGTMTDMGTAEAIDTRRRSLFGRFDYQLKDKYIVTFTIRGDESSKFKGKNTLGIFPALALAWKIDEEKFLEEVEFVDQLKLRISYGETGNDRINVGLTQFLFGTSTDRGPGFGDNTPQLIYKPASSYLYNPDLKWETTTTSNIGLDFTMLKKRLIGSIDYYENETRDLLYTKAIPSSTGFTNQYDNIGVTKNKGFEVALTGYIIDKKDFTLSTNFNIGKNNLTIASLEGTQSAFAQSNWAGTGLRNISDYQLEVGGQVGNIYGFVTDGYYSVDDFESYDEENNKYILKEGIADISALVNMPLRPGTLKLKDLNGDNEITDDDDRQIIGNALPDFQGGFGFNVRYKNFDFSTFLNFQVGNDVYNTNKIQLNQYLRVTHGNLLTTMSLDNRFTYLDIDGSYTGTPGGIVTDLEQLRELNQGKSIWSHASNDTYTAVIHSWAVEDGSFLRLNNVTLGYSLPNALISKIGLSKLRVFATGTNLFIWTKYSGYDPEVNSSRDPFVQGLDRSSYPRARSFTMGVNLTF